MKKKNRLNKENAHVPEHMFKDRNSFQPNQADLDKAKAEFFEKETDLKKLCYDYLIALPMSHPIDTPNFPMKRRPVKQRGIADLHHCFYGLYLAIETKIGKNGQDEWQEEYQRNIESSGGIYLLIYKFDNLVKQIASIKRKAEKLWAYLDNMEIEL
jgi:hypothetical protein